MVSAAEIRETSEGDWQVWETACLLGTHLVIFFLPFSCFSFN